MGLGSEGLRALRILVLLPSNLFAAEIVGICESVSANVFALDNGRRRSILMRGRARDYRAVPFFDGERVNPHAIDELEKMCIQHRIDVVVPFDLDGAALLWFAKERIAARCFPFSAPATLQQLSDKWRCMDVARRAGVDTPDSVLLENLDELDSPALDRFRFPAIVKPPRLEGSRGVKLVANIDALKRHVSSQAPYAKLPLILQEYVEGTIVDVDLLALDGRVLLLSCRDLNRRGTVRFFRNAQAEAAAAAIVAAAGYTGIANLDFVHDPHTGNTRFLDFNPRSWSNIRWTRLAGIGFIEGGLEIAMGGGAEMHPPVPSGTVHSARAALRAVMQGRLRDISAANRAALAHELSRPIQLGLIKIGLKIVEWRVRHVVINEAALFKLMV
ncbi:MAG TPA: ATP-grasp domain-containing protein [Rhizomicrobium sp.]|nr:ATP-grasp domain-containing protein [Rhizomicrobium sp.]